MITGVRRVAVLLVAAICGAVLLGRLAPGAVSAHETRVIASGRYQAVVGFLNEPAYEGQLNALSLVLSRYLASLVGGGVCDTRRMIEHTCAPSYKRHRFPPEIIAHAVWLYFRFALSYRDVEELLAERGVIVTYESVRQWCQKFGQAYANGLRRRQPRPGDTWHLDGVIASPPFGVPPRRTG